VGKLPELHCKTDKDESKYGGTFHELIEQTERGIGVLGGAMVDDMLRDFIIKSWRTDGSTLTRDVRGRLVGEGGVLSFSIKNDIAYISGLIGADTYADLDRIRRIRNLFAHRQALSDAYQKPDAVSFDTPSIKARCNKLLIVDRVVVYLDDNIMPTGTPKDRYVCAVINFVFAFDLCICRVSSNWPVVDALIKR
jgi:hypothetical protein